MQHRVPSTARPRGGFLLVQRPYPERGRTLQISCARRRSALLLQPRAHLIGASTLIDRVRA